MIITIGRQLGSGGREIGHLLAQAIDFTYYDKALLRIAAEASGISPEIFEKSDEKTKHNLISGMLDFLYSSWNNAVIPYSAEVLTHEALFQIQSDVIRQLSEDHSSLFVGRCADYILRDHPRALHLFISADTEDRVSRLMTRQGYSREQALERMKKVDKQRAAYYNYYTGRIWGMAQNYHLCINSSLLGIEGTVDFIRSFYSKRAK